LKNNKEFVLSCHWLLNQSYLNIKRLRGVVVSVAGHENADH